MAYLGAPAGKNNQLLAMVNLARNLDGSVELAILVNGAITLDQCQPIGAMWDDWCGMARK